MFNAPEKQALLDQAVAHVASVRETTATEIDKTKSMISRFQAERGTDPVRQKLLAHFSERLDQLHHLFPSPYFFRCDVRSETNEPQTLFFSKFHLPERSIFSWTTPAARLRFDPIGPASYPLPGTGKTWNGSLARKDQFLIVGGKIAFMASEAETYSRTLIHQERLPQRKAGFMLPEIVEQMEKAQDDVIRAPETGSFLIAGPAGSGKTTLALHRLAYLLQSPDTAERFPTERMIVLVQDERTKAYFSRLLPDLGIHEVTVTTFGTWALERLGLKGITIVRRPNGVNDEVDHFEHQKQITLRSSMSEGKVTKNPFVLLRRLYQSLFTKEDARLFDAQETARQLDRFDLALLLRHAFTNGPFLREEEYLVRKGNFQVIRRNRSVPLDYSLIVVDEAQNYLPEQLAILRSCTDTRTRAILYVGDLGQQVLLGTPHDWIEAGETFDTGHRVTLEKVYRNTKAILRYVDTRGYPTVIPEEMTEGAPVMEQVCATIEEEVTKIQQIITANPGKQIGILAPSTDLLRPFTEAFADQTNIHVLTVHEAQGVEFDIACVLGFSADFFQQLTHEIDRSLIEERAKIKRDLLYVALTRAMDELHVFEHRPNS